MSNAANLAKNGIILKNQMKAIREYLDQDGVNEIIINKPGEIFVEKMGETIRYDVPELSKNVLGVLSQTISSYNGQAISEVTPLLSGSLDRGERVQIVIPPACESGQMAFSIRKPSTLKMMLDDYEKAGAFDSIVFRANNITDEDKHLLELKEAGNIKEFLTQAVRYRKNIVVSGGTSTGKTTFMNSLMRAIPEDERLITIEDTREIQLDHHNALNLIYSKGGQGVSKVTCKELLEACLRLRPDRILLSELRGEEAFFYLRATNSGHPGSITSIHANSTLGAFSQLTMMVMQAGAGLTQEQINTYLHSVVDIVVQLKRLEDGRRVLTEIHYEPEQQIS